MKKYIFSRLLMINELYSYACPKLSEEQKSSFSFLPTILGVSLFSLLIALLGGVTLCIVVTTLYVGLSFLCFLDKDFNSKHLKLTMLGIVDMSIAFIYIIEYRYSQYHVVLWSIILGVVFFVIYEVLLFIKVKNKSNSFVNKTGATASIGASTLFLIALIYKVVNSISGLQFFVGMALVLLCASAVLLDMIFVQKLIIYLFTRTKVQVNCEDVKKTETIDKKS